MSISQVVAGHAARFRYLLDDPAAVQARQLATLVVNNAQSAWGLRHQFATIEDYRQYAQNVPISKWDDLAPWMDRVAKGERTVLTSAPVLVFEETGGSSGGAKLVPYTEDGLASFRKGLLPWLDDLLVSYPVLGQGKFYWAISPACRVPRTTPGGVPVGLASDAAYFGAELAPLVLDALAVPPTVGAIADFTQWVAATVEHLMACKELTMISVWSPTFLSELLRLAGSGLDYRTLWPQLKVISCWDQASARPQAQALQDLFPGVVVQGKGLLATEGLVSIPLVGFEFPVLAIESGFWEFLDASGRALRAHEVEKDADYTLVMSTASGLYRYVLGDRVRIPGFAGRTPMIEFIGRGDTSSDLCGEKLVDEFVARALAPLALRFAMLRPVCAPGNTPGYALLLDVDEVPEQTAVALTHQIEQALCANPQYAYARNLGQLVALTPVGIRQPLARWFARGLARGQRLGDIKLPALGPDDDWYRP
ncbi:GH3 auxin-responsive promoter family protein [Polaromonas sp.]|uniref:GH3 family domain-containing protein n=1 Tax=Polaromonas sp. TaxID=1869339 RepID=UPI003266AE09